jgi:hypothetical protein
VTSANEDMEPGSRVPAAEREERQRIYGDFLSRKLGASDVHVYVLGPDRTSLAGLDIDSAMKTPKAISFLTSLAEQQHIQAGPPPFQPRPRSVPPPTESADPVLHLTARKTERSGWNEFPSENWIALSATEWDQLLPPSGTGLRAVWTLPVPVATKLAEWIYPQTEETHRSNRSKVEIADIRLTMVTLDGALCRARIDGTVRLVHSFYPGRPSDDRANSELIGFADFDLLHRKVQRLRIVTQKAEYQGTQFACSLVSVSRETLDALR